MSLKRITDRQRKNGLCWCDKCKNQGKGKVRAEWFGYGTLLCQEHYNGFEIDSYTTMADEMTWMRI